MGGEEGIPNISSESAVAGSMGSVTGVSSFWTGIWYWPVREA